LSFEEDGPTRTTAGCQDELENILIRLIW